MRIAVNTRLLMKNKLEGIGWFTFETLKRITQNHKEHEFLFIFDRTFSEEFIFTPNVKPYVLKPVTRHPFLWYIWFEHSIPSFLHKHNIDLFLSPDGYISLSTRIPQISVIHDINFAHRPKDLPLLTRTYYNYYFPRFAHRARRIATVSEYSKNDICNTYRVPSEKVDVVYNGAGAHYQPLNDAEKAKVKEEYMRGADYFIFVGSLHPRKNIPGLLSAFEAFKNETRSNIKLAIVGEVMFKTGEINSLLQKMNHREAVVFTGRKNAAELGRLLAGALALVFVPFFEGFGIPVVEAMYCDVPVIASNVTSLPEVAGDAALPADPHSVDAIKNAMVQIAKDAQLRNQLIEKAREQRQKFTWDKSAARLWECIEKIRETIIYPG